MYTDQLMRFIHYVLQHQTALDRLHFDDKIKETRERERKKKNIPILVDDVRDKPLWKSVYFHGTGNW